MHWADVAASGLKEIPGEHRIATGITPCPLMLKQFGSDPGLISIVIDSIEASA